MTADEFLTLMDRIPHLLVLARQLDDLHRYQAQDALREQHRREGRPFLYSMPMRHLYRCQSCGKQDTDILHELENPRNQLKIKIPELVLHQAQFHGTPPGKDLADFLQDCQKDIK
jgi:hypothetical protein